MLGTDRLAEALLLLEVVGVDPHEADPPIFADPDAVLDHEVDEALTIDEDDPSV